jgi:plastocyanin
VARKPILLVLGTAVAALAAAGCGGGGGSSATSASSTPASASTPAPAASSTTGGSASSSSSGGGSTLKLAADPSGALAFNKTKLSAKAGKVTITMSNPSPVSHGVAVQGSGVNQVGNTVGSGGTSTVTVTLKPGTYTFYCPVPGHEQAGMKGTLTVQ